MTKLEVLQYCLGSKRHPKSERPVRTTIFPPYTAKCIVKRGPVATALYYHTYKLSLPFPPRVIVSGGLGTVLRPFPMPQNVERVPG